MAAVSVSARLRPSVSGTPAARIIGSGALAVGDKLHEGFLASVVTGSDQSVAYEAIAAPLLQKLREGYSCTLLAYGQTGSGKTHSVFGPPGSLTEASLAAPLDAAGVPPQWGLFPRIALALLQSSDCTLHASAIEIYSEHAFDLLADRAPLSVGSRKAGRNVGGGPTCTTSSGSGTAAIMTSGAVGSDLAFHNVHPPSCRCGKCHLAKKAELAAQLARRDALPRGSGSRHSAGRARGDGPMGGGLRARAPGDDALPRAATAPHTQPAATAPGGDEEVGTVGETRVELRTAADVAKLARTVELTRVAVGHLLNARSSRSHCFVHLHLTERSDGGRTLTRRQLVCVDLAGSERILRTGVEGVAQKQAVGINSSLTALGKVVRAVGERCPHVPYRDSTLTQLLRGSFGGRSCTSVVVTLASDAEHAEETRCSLAFGARMAVVRNHATVVIGQDAGAEARDAVRLLEHVRAAAARLHAEGHGERFGNAEGPSAIQSFKDNVRRKAEEDVKALEARSCLVELKAGGGDAGAMAALQSRAEAAEAESANLRDIILRQKSIKDFWIAPKESYVKKLAEVRELEARVAMLGMQVQSSNKIQVSETLYV